MHKIVEEDMEFIANAELPFEKFFGKTLLISGGNGFLPAYMVRFLLHLNKTRHARIRVLALVRNRAKALACFPEYGEDPHFGLLVQDVTSPIVAEGPVHYIVHAASQASPKYYGTDPVGTLMANTLGTYRLLELARDKSAESVLFFSSGEVYGSVPNHLIPIAESAQGEVDQLNVRSCYAESKRMGETMCVSWNHQHGTSSKIVRPFHTYGPGMNLTDGRVFADFVKNVVKGEDIVMMSDGLATRSFCYLADATIGYFAVLLKGRPGEAYNIGSDIETSIGELADIMATILPEQQLKVVRSRRATTAHYLVSRISRIVPSIDKAMNELNWRPLYSVRDGFLRTVMSFL